MRQRVRLRKRHTKAHTYRESRESNNNLERETERDAPNEWMVRAFTGEEAARLIPNPVRFL